MMDAFKWSEEQQPNENIRYNHVTLETPLGQIVIDWKSWKESPSYDISLNGLWIGCEYSLPEAKQLAINFMAKKLKELNKFFFIEA